MPTPGGLPKAGERVELYALDHDTYTWSEYQNTGTVVERGRGEYWSLTVLFDGQSRSTLLVDAPYLWRVGALKFAKSADV
jgi:hypothetical protein